MKLRPLVLLSFIVLVNFFISNDTPVDAERRADDSQMNDPHGPALLFKASKYKTVSATTTGITLRISVAADGTQ